MLPETASIVAVEKERKKKSCAIEELITPHAEAAANREQKSKALSGRT